MRLLIDASNLLDGGGVTHLIELLKIWEHDNENEFFVICSSRTSQILKEFRYLKTTVIPEFNSNKLRRNIWLYKESAKWCRNHNIDILFNPGGGYIGRFRPYVTMCRNMLIFQAEERKLYGLSKTFFRLKLLEFIHSYSLKNSDGIIFISDFANKFISDKIKNLPVSEIINHGVSFQFQLPLKTQLPIGKYTFENPFKLLYVSIIDVYKHHKEIAKAVALLRKDGFPVEISFVGGNYPPAFNNVLKLLSEIDPDGEFISLPGKQTYNDLVDFYKNCDGFIFGSSCENMPNILVEAMRSGLPIISSNRPPMPEFLKNGGYYFDPYDVKSIYDSLKEYLLDHEKREHNASLSQKYSLKYSWQDCAAQTLNFIEGRLANTIY